jgi:uncharacterized protein YjiS (DUF1127 family)
MSRLPVGAQDILEKGGAIKVRRTAGAKHSSARSGFAEPHFGPAAVRPAPRQIEVTMLAQQRQHRYQDPFRGGLTYVRRHSVKLPLPTRLPGPGPSGLSLLASIISLKAPARAKTRPTAAFRFGFGKPLTDAAAPSGHLTAVAAWRQRHRLRPELYSLNDRMLKDIGISRWENRVGRELSQTEIPHVALLNRAGAELRAFLASFAATFNRSRQSSVLKLDGELERLHCMLDPATNMTPRFNCCRLSAERR